jgi:hypothetical protein
MPSLKTHEVRWGDMTYVDRFCPPLVTAPPVLHLLGIGVPSPTRQHPLASSGYRVGAPRPILTFGSSSNPPPPASNAPNGHIMSTFHSPPPPTASALLRPPSRLSLSRLASPPCRHTKSHTPAKSATAPPPHGILHAAVPVDYASAARPAPGRAGGLRRPKAPRRGFTRRPLIRRPPSRTHPPSLGGCR